MVIKGASLSTTEVGTSLQAVLEEAMSDFQVAESTIKTHKNSFKLLKLSTLQKNQEKVERTKQEKF